MEPITVPNGIILVNISRFIKQYSEATEHKFV